MNIAIIDIKGLYCKISRNQCSWYRVAHCNEILHENKKYKFLVLKIDNSKNQIELTRKFPEENPWNSKKLPKLGDVIEVVIASSSEDYYYGRFVDNIEIIIPKYELAWLKKDEKSENEILGKKLKVIIYEKLKELRTLKGSVRQLEDNPWPMIRQNLPKGTKLKGQVIEVSSRKVEVALPNGLIGYIPFQYLKQDDYEYADFETNILKGQELNVVISKVNIKSQRILLNFNRNIE